MLKDVQFPRWKHFYLQKYGRSGFKVMIGFQINTARTVIGKLRIEKCIIIEIGPFNRSLAAMAFMSSFFHACDVIY
jgi:hypothetical protein